MKSGVHPAKAPRLKNVFLLSESAAVQKPDPVLLPVLPALQNHAAPAHDLTGLTFRPSVKIIVPS